MPKRASSPGPIPAPDYSRFARALLQAQPALAEELTAAGQPWTRADMQAFVDADASTSATAGTSQSPDRVADVARRLRHLRARVMLRLMQRDLAGTASLTEVCQTMTTLAEVAIHTGLESFAPESRDPAAPNLMVIGMGKLGGGELNVSSDIDLVFIYAGDDDASRGGGVSNHEHFQAQGKRLVGLLDHPTEDGMLFGSTCAYGHGATLGRSP